MSHKKQNNRHTDTNAEKKQGAFTLIVLPIIFVLRLIAKGLRYLYNTTIGVFVNAIKVIFDDKSNIFAEQSGKGRKQRTRPILSLFYTRGSRILYRLIFNIALPVLAMALFVRVVDEYRDTRYAIEISYSGQTLGYVSDESTFEKAKDVINQGVVSVANHEIGEEITPEFNIKKVNGAEILDERKLASKIMESEDIELVRGDGLFVDGVFAGAVSELGCLDKYIDQVISLTNNENSVDTAAFNKKLTTKIGLYQKQDIVPIKELCGYISPDHTKLLVGLVELSNKKATPLLARRYAGKSVEVQTTANDTTTKSSYTRPALSITYTKEQKKVRDIDYKINKTKSNRYSIGESKVTKKGRKGAEELLLEITYVDGEEVDREIIDKSTIKEPIDEEVIVGTLETSFIWPLEGGYVSSGFAARWGEFHCALDIAKRGGAYGKPVLAARSGKVVFVGYQGTYGNIIKLDHGNGIQTYYAHNSQNLVSVGQTVTQGQVIAKVGATGRATGPHVHFEVRKNGVAQNPYSYLK